MKSIRMIVAFFTLIAISLQCHAQLLWSIEKKGLQKTSYLYGTIHEGDSSVIAWSEDFMEIFYSCEMFMAEIDLTQKEELGNVMNTLYTMGMRDPNETVSAALQDSIDQIEKVIAEKFDSATAAQLIQMKPILSSIQLLSLEKIKNGNLRASMLDTNSTRFTVMPDWVLTDKAQQAEINIRGLETPEDQINALFKIPMHVQWKALYDEMLHPDTVKGPASDINELMKIYKNQDLVKLNQFILDANLPQEIAKELIIVRNYNMLASMEDIFLDQESVFFAVGAGHLGGEKGLINLLKWKGYTVKPVAFQWTQKF